jgi:hypothetical protein
MYQFMIRLQFVPLSDPVTLYAVNNNLTLPSGLLNLSQCLSRTWGI